MGYIAVLRRYYLVVRYIVVLRLLLHSSKIHYVFSCYYHMCNIYYCLYSCYYLVRYITVYSCYYQCGIDIPDFSCYYIVVSYIIGYIDGTTSL